MAGRGCKQKGNQAAKELALVLRFRRMRNKAGILADAQQIVGLNSALHRGANSLGVTTVTRPVVLGSGSAVKCSEKHLSLML